MGKIISKPLMLSASNDFTLNDFVITLPSLKAATSSRKTTPTPANPSA
jgi:hypothetical protein